MTALVLHALFPGAGERSGERDGETSGEEPGAGSARALRGSYAGSAACRPCHPFESDLWQDSHHALAERPLEPALDAPAFEPPRAVGHGALAARVLRGEHGFEIEMADAAGGATAVHRPARVIGVAPLRQFVIPFPRGQYQVMALAFDPARGDWFDAAASQEWKPGEWGFWTNRGMTWNSMCASCHMTALQKSYDADLDAYSTSWLEPGVGCEACHGPYGAHVEWHRTEGGALPWPGRPARSPDGILDACGSCHARRDVLTAGFVPGEAFTDHYRLTLPDAGEIFHADGQVHEEDFEYGSFLMSRMHGEGVRCLNCHDPHTAKLFQRGNTLCLTCHKGKVDPAAHSHHDPSGEGGQCVSCHMPLTTYMERHPRRDHGFTIPDPLLTKELGIPNACNRCHSDRSVDWAIEAVERWYGARMERSTRARARVVASARRGEESAVRGLVAMAAEERSAAWRATAVGLLAPWVDREDVAAALPRWLEDPSPHVRGAAARITEGAPALQPLVAPLLEDPSRLARVEAAWVLREGIDLSRRAARDLVLVLDESSDQPGGALRRAGFHLARGDPGRAEAWIERAIAWSPGIAAYHHQLAVARREAGRLAAALEAIEEARRLEPREAQWPFVHGQLAAEAGDIEGAALAMAKACELDPRLARAWYNLGLACARLGRSEEALEALRRAEAEDPLSAEFPYARATVHLERGETAEAREAARRALALAPDYPDALQILRALGGE
jgi:predicted CXXCH cytochrome family protein